MVLALSKGPTTAIIVEPPKVLSFSKNSKETLAFFDVLKKAIYTNEKQRRKGVTRPKPMRLELEKVERISLPCAVVLSAELKRWTTHREITPRLHNYAQWDKRVRTLLVHLGTFQHLGIKRKAYRRYADETFPGQVFLVGLTSADVQDGEKVEKLQEKLMRIADFFKPQKYIFRALLEATNNVIEHAYENTIALKYANLKGNNWYATASYDPSNQSLRFFVYDQGVGIPKSLESKRDWKQLIKNWCDSMGITQHDTDTIEAAFELGKTRTMQSERGKGLRDMLNVIHEAGAGYIRVLSGHGDYKVHVNGDVEKFRHGSHIGGTLVEWSIPIDAVN
ncbi:MAG: hypothetical protein JJ858_10180 [Rhizobiaceae bacterium]|nr:hypothetical protein [Rhizobiaceae bacterium]